MKRLLFAVAVACLFAANALAADPPATSSPTPVPAGTVIVPGTPTVMTTTGTTSTRRSGLFSRLRNRMSGANYSTPTNGVIVAPTTPITPAPRCPLADADADDQAGQTAVTGSGVVTASGSGVVAGSTTTSMMPMATTTTRTRMRA